MALSSPAQLLWCLHSAPSARANYARKVRCSPHGITCAASKRRTSSSVSAQLKPPRGPEHVRIHLPGHLFPVETEIHDGEQSPGVTMTSKDKLLLVRQLANLKGDSIYAGLPICSPEYLDDVPSISMEVANTPVEYGDSHLLILYGISDPECNPTIGIMLDRRIKILSLPLKPDEVVDTAEEVVSFDRSIGMPRGCGKVVMAVTGFRVLEGGLYTGVNTQESSTMTSKMDLNGIHKFKGTSETTSSGDVGSTHENGFDDNGKLSGSHTVGTKLVKLGYGKEIKDPCKCGNKDAEEKKLPAFLGRCLGVVISKCEDIIWNGLLSSDPLGFVRQMVQTGMRVSPFFLIFVGLALMWYGRKAAESTSHSA